MKRFISRQGALKLLVLMAAVMVLAGFAWSEIRGRIDQASQPLLVADADGTPKILAKGDPKVASEAFSEAAKVFFSPRCANCHPAADAPTQGDAMTPHTQGVTRGPKGEGIYGMQCATCHQRENLEGEHMPPGTSKGWHMPPADMKMVFQGLTAGQLCRQLKDPKKNGGLKTPAEAIHHIEADPLVLWGWEPGNNRTTPPISHEKFVELMETWVANGAACPE